MENENRSAFPLPNDVPQDYSGSNIDGLTKREYFAGLALQGLCANQFLDYKSPKETVRKAIDLADFLLSELDK